MKFVASLLLSLGLALGLSATSLPVSAAGATANVSWTAPTAYTSGQAMPAADIAFYTLNWTGAFPGSLKVTAPALTANVPVACGSVTFTVSVTTTNGALYPSTTSANSNSVPYASGITCAPVAPVLSVN